jgi:hypothetical protein
MVLNANGGLTSENKNADLVKFDNDQIKTALILNDVVEKIMNLGPPMPQIIFGNYQFRDVTEAKRAETGSSMFFFEVESEDGLVLVVSSDESMWAIMASHPLAVEIPAELDVQLGWTYTVETGFVSN